MEVVAYIVINITLFSLVLSLTSVLLYTNHNLSSQPLCKNILKLIVSLDLL
jgi:hypothetical protein